MSVRINPERCIGCRRCVDLCPGNLIKWNTDGKYAFLRRPRDCWGCAVCVKACPGGAIIYYLGADIGGRGTTMTVTYRGENSTWTFIRPDGSRREITVDRTASNRY